MAIMATEGGGGGDYAPVPQGTHIAICNLVADLGDQEMTWEGVTSIKHQIYLRWEIPAERIEWTDKDGVPREGPMQIGRTYTLSLHAKSGLRADLESWRGRAFSADELRGFDVSKLLGKPCMVSVTHAEKGGKTYANIASVSGVPKGLTPPVKAEHGNLLYDADAPGAFQDLPQWLRDKIGRQVIKQPPSASGSPAHDDLDDDVPF